MTSEDWNPATAKEAEPPEMLLSYADILRENICMRELPKTLVWSRSGIAKSDATIRAREFLESTKTP